MEIKIPFHGGIITMELPAARELDDVAVTNVLAGLAIAVGTIRDLFAREHLGQPSPDTMRRAKAVSKLTEAEALINDA